MKIGELARRTGLSASRIRFYEASGLIEARRLGNGYRDYPEQVVQALEIITCGQQAGFSLDEMRRLTSASKAGAQQHDLLLASLRHKVAEIEAMQQRLAQNRAQLLAVIEGIESKPEGMDCQANAQRLIAGWQDGEGGEQKKSKISER